ncbi:hypothetical protein [Pedobacter sp. NJ-S-72]
MRISFYLIFSALIICSASSCSKGDLVNEPLFGKFSINNFITPERNVTIVEGEVNQLPVPAKNISLISGENRFRFYDKEILLLDTSLKVEPFKEHVYFMFKPNERSTFKIFDTKLNGFDLEELPQASTIKISLAANFSKGLPDKVNIYLITTTYKAPAPQEIQVGEFLNVSGSFSGFKKVIPGKDNLLHPVNSFTLVIKDIANQNVLAKIPFTLPLKPNLEELANSVYLLYADDKGGITTLMSK